MTDNTETSGRGGSGGSRAGRGAGQRAGRSRSTPRQTELASDARFSDSDFEGETRQNFSTKIYPGLQEKMEGIVLQSKLTGTPRGVDQMTKLVQEALARYVETVEQTDGIKITAPANRRR